MSIILRSDAASSNDLMMSAQAILAASELMSLATINNDGSPHANTAFFAYDSVLRIVFLSDPASLHCRNVGRDPRVALTIFDTRQPWPSAKSGLQVFGTCARSRNQDFERAIDNYAIRFPDFSEWAKALPEVERGALGFYEILPLHIKVFDETRFGDDTFLFAEVVR